MAGTSGFEQETRNILASLPRVYSGRWDAINTFVLSLKTGATSGTNIFNKLDVLCIAGLSLPDSLINWRNPGVFNSIAINSPTFVADRGFTASAAGSKYIDTNFVPFEAGGAHQLTSASMGAYSRTISSEDGADMGVIGFNISRSFLYAKRVDQNPLWAINNSQGVINSSPAVSNRLWSVNKNPFTQDLYREGVQLRTTFPATEGLPDASIFVGCRNTQGVPDSFSTRQYSAWYIGGGLTDAELTDFSAAIQTYLTYLGAAV
jgi:hypothetical protein